MLQRQEQRRKRKEEKEKSEAEAKTKAETEAKAVYDGLMAAAEQRRQENARKAAEQQATAERTRARQQAQREARDKLQRETNQQRLREQKQREEQQRLEEAEAFERKIREQERKQAEARQQLVDRQKEIEEDIRRENHLKAVGELNTRHKQEKLKSVLTGRKKANEEQALKDFFSKWKGNTEKMISKANIDEFNRQVWEPREQLDREIKQKGFLTQANNRLNQTKREALGRNFSKWKNQIRDIKHKEAIDREQQYEDVPGQVPREPFTTIRRRKRGREEDDNDLEKKQRESEADEWERPEPMIPRKPFTFVRKKGILETKKEMKTKELNAKSAQRKANLARRLHAGTAIQPDEAYNEEDDDNDDELDEVKKGTKVKVDEREIPSENRESKRSNTKQDVVQSAGGGGAAGGAAKKEPVWDQTRLSKIGKALADDPVEKEKMAKSKKVGKAIQEEMRKKEREDMDDELQRQKMLESAENFTHGKKGNKRKYDKSGKENKNKKNKKEL